MSDSYTFRRPYHNLKQSMTEFFQSPAMASYGSSFYPRSMFEKPYLDMTYPEMQLPPYEPDWPGPPGDPTPPGPYPETNWPPFNYNPGWPDINWPDYPGFGPIPRPYLPDPQFGDVPGWNPPGFEPSWPDPTNPGEYPGFGGRTGEGFGERCNACAFDCIPAINCGDEILCRVQAQCVYDPGRGADCNLYTHQGGSSIPTGGSIDTSSINFYMTAGMARINYQMAMGLSVCGKGDPGWHVFGDFINAWLEKFGSNTCYLHIKPNCYKDKAKILVRFITMLCDDCESNEDTSCSPCLTAGIEGDYVTTDLEGGETVRLWAEALFDNMTNCCGHFSWGIVSGPGVLISSPGDLCRSRFVAPSQTETDQETEVGLYCTDGTTDGLELIDTVTFTVPGSDPCVDADPVTIVSPTAAGATISPGGSLTIEVDGGVGPFTWSVTGSGGNWSLDDEETEGRTNVLRLADADNCATNGASATVTVTDLCEDEASVSTVPIRNSQGQWTLTGYRYSDRSDFITAPTYCGACGSCIDGFTIAPIYEDATHRWTFPITGTYKTSGIMRNCSISASPCSLAAPWNAPSSGTCPEPPCGDGKACGGLCSFHSTYPASKAQVYAERVNYYTWSC